MTSLPDAVPVGDIESLLTCSICLETLNDPRTLPYCFHSFCKCCLEKFVKKQREKAVGKEIKDFNCPTCRSVFTLKPKEEVEGMSGSHFIRNMLDVMAIQRRAKVAKCSRCEESATCRCVTCEIFMCEKCLKAHESFPSLKKHTVLSTDQLSEPENQAKIKGRLHCKEHKDKKLKFFCETCKELICRYCMDFKHVRPDHLCLPIEEVAEKGKKALKTSYDILMLKSTQVNNALQSTADAMQAVKESAKRAKEEIDQQSDEVKKIIIQKVEERARIKKDEVDQMCNNTYEKLAGQSNELKVFVDRVKGTVDLSKNLLENGDCVEILSTQSMIEESVEKIEESVEKIEKECPAEIKSISHGFIQYRAMPIDYAQLTGILDSLGIVAKFLDCILSKTSIILKDKDEYVNQMVEWLKDHNFEWRLCYRASRDGWHAKDFHSHCDDKGSTVTVVKLANDFIFGGFTDQSWAGKGYKRSTSSFLFSLKNKDDLPPFKALILKPDNAIYADPSSGPSFGKCRGNSPDLYISCQSHINMESYSMFSKVYQSPSERYRINCNLLAGSHNFKPVEIEVFY